MTWATKKKKEYAVFSGLVQKTKSTLKGPAVEIFTKLSWHFKPFASRKENALQITLLHCTHTHTHIYIPSNFIIAATVLKGYCNFDIL